MEKKCLHIIHRLSRKMYKLNVNNNNAIDRHIYICIKMFWSYKYNLHKNCNNLCTFLSLFPSQNVQRVYY